MKPTFSTISKSAWRLLPFVVPAVGLLACESKPLDEKLERQFGRFEAARSALAAYAAENEEPLDYDWWTGQMDPGRAFRLSAADLENLRQLQAERIRSAYLESKNRSALDLDRIRADGKVRRFCEEIPKGGMLHVHPNGTLDETTVARILEGVNPVLDRHQLNKEVFALCLAAGHDELARIKHPLNGVRYLDLSEEDRRTFRSFFFFTGDRKDHLLFMVPFDLISLLRDTEAMDVWSEIYKDFFSRCQRLGIKYVEFSKGYSTYDPDGTDRISKTAALGLQYGVVARWNYSFSRSREPEKNLKRLKDFLDDTAVPEITGIDLLGPEDKYPTFEAGHLIYGYMEALRRAGRTTLRRTIHAAELGRPGNFRDALIFGVERLGHGARAHEDPLGMEYASRLQPGLEVNLVSNIVLDYHNHYETHPFLDLLRLGVKASLSTDDEGILMTDLVHEHEQAVTHTNITYDEIKRMAMNSIETAFADNTVKTELLERLKAEFDGFERQWAEYATRPGEDAGQ